MNKIRAYQIDPAKADSNYFFDGPEGGFYYSHMDGHCLIVGNRRICSFGDAEGYDAEQVERMVSDFNSLFAIRDAQTDPLSDEEWRAMVEENVGDYFDGPIGDDKLKELREFTCDYYGWEVILNFVLKGNWCEVTLKGYSQGDYALVLYDCEEVEDEKIEELGICLFNKGEEYRIEDENEESQGCTYVPIEFPTAQQVKDWIADHCGYDVDEVLSFDGYDQTPRYKPAE